MRCKEACFAVTSFANQATLAGSNSAFVRERRPGPALSTRDAGKRQQHKAKTGTRQGRKREGGVVLETTPVLMRDTDGRYALDRQSACVGARGGLGIAQEAWANENGMDGWMDGRWM
ncbi:hypothetical protein V8C44DRAFT_328700 [Trichoderma aethiopicum]